MSTLCPYVWKRNLGAALIEELQVVCKFVQNIVRYQNTKKKEEDDERNNSINLLNDDDDLNNGSTTPKNIHIGENDLPTASPFKTTWQTLSPLSFCLINRIKHTIDPAIVMSEEVLTFTACLFNVELWDPTMSELDTVLSLFGEIVPLRGCDVSFSLERLMLSEIATDAIELLSNSTGITVTPVEPPITGVPAAELLIDRDIPAAELETDEDEENSPRKGKGKGKGTGQQDEAPRTQAHAHLKPRETQDTAWHDNKLNNNDWQQNNNNWGGQYVEDDRWDLLDSISNNKWEDCSHTAYDPLLHDTTTDINKVSASRLNSTYHNKATLIRSAAYRKVDKYCAGPNAILVRSITRMLTYYTGGVAEPKWDNPILSNGRRLDPGGPNGFIPDWIQKLTKALLPGPRSAIAKEAWNMLTGPESGKLDHREIETHWRSLVQHSNPETLTAISSYFITFGTEKPTSTLLDARSLSVNEETYDRIKSQCLLIKSLLRSETSAWSLSVGTDTLSRTSLVAHVEILKKYREVLTQMLRTRITPIASDIFSASEQKSIDECDQAILITAAVFTTINLDQVFIQDPGLLTAIFLELKERLKEFTDYRQNADAAIYTLMGTLDYISEVQKGSLHAQQEQLLLDCDNIRVHILGKAVSMWLQKAAIWKSKKTKNNKENANAWKEWNDWKGDSWKHKQKQHDQKYQQLDQKYQQHEQKYQKTKGKDDFITIVKQSYAAIETKIKSLATDAERQALMDDFCLVARQPPKSGWEVQDRKFRCALSIPGLCPMGPGACRRAHAKFTLDEWEANKGSKAFT